MKLHLFKSILLLGLASLFFGSCKKEYEGIETLDDQNIQQYIQQNHLSMQKYDTTGIYYQITTPGSGAEVNYTDRVFLTFTMKSLDGSYNSTDENLNRYSSYLGYLTRAHSGLPDAFQIAVKDILKRKGGSVRLIIPSRLAYGRNGLKTIPGNASLDCELKLYDVNNQTEFEDVFVKKYIQEKNIAGLTRLSSGVYYQIITPGTGTDSVTVNSDVSVAYTGKLTDGTVFDSTTTAAPLTSTLSSLIAGWQQGLPKITKGGKIRLIIPPALGYGSSPQGSKIPANSILDFEIELVDVKN